MPDLWDIRCNKCFSPSMRLSRCGRCQTAFYCSKACQQADWKVDHRKECKNLRQLMQLRLRNDQVMDVLLLGRVLRRSDGEEPTPKALVWYEEDLEDQERILLAALTQKLHLVDGTHSMKAMLRMLSRFQNNNFFICDELLLAIGAGCFPLGAMINHSCDPNCAVTFAPMTLDLEVRAMKPIKRGEEVLQSYVDVAPPRRERQVRLQQKYHFHCECIRCSQPLQDPGSVDAFLDADIHGVPQELWTQQYPQEVIQSLMEASYPAANDIDLTLQQPHRIDALEKLVEHQRVLLHRDNIARLQTLSTLFSIETSRGNLEKANEYGEQMLEFYRRIYTPNHPMTGLHLYTLGDLCSQLAQSRTAATRWKKESIECLTEAQRILTITHGKDHRLVKMLADRLKTFVS